MCYLQADDEHVGNLLQAEHVMQGLCAQGRLGRRRKVGSVSRLCADPESSSPRACPALIRGKSQISRSVMHATWVDKGRTADLQVCQACDLRLMQCVRLHKSMNMLYTCK